MSDKPDDWVCANYKGKFDRIEFDWDGKVDYVPSDEARLCVAPKNPTPYATMQLTFQSDERTIMLFIRGIQRSIIRQRRIARYRRAMKLEGK